MPTNFLRSEPAPKTRPLQRPVPVGERRIMLSARQARLVLRPHATRTAELIWHALPLFGIAETWGESLHFEVPVKAPRDRTARLNGRVGEAYYWADDERIVICWGPTPISREGEIRLMRPCNVWASVDGDPRALLGLSPGEKISISRMQARSSSPD